MRFYGAQTFDNGNISWPWYRYLEKWMPAAQAAEAVTLAEAVAIGAIGVMDGAAHQKAIGHLRDEVYKVR